MKEYIDRRELIEILNRYDIEQYNGLVYSIIMQAPAHDVVRVVRCKNCKNHRELDTTRPSERRYAEHIEACKWCRVHNIPVFPDEYCSSGERQCTGDLQRTE